MEQYLGDLGGIRDIFWVFGLLAVSSLVDHLWIAAWEEKPKNKKIENENLGTEREDSP